LIELFQKFAGFGAEPQGLRRSALSSAFYFASFFLQVKKKEGLLYRTTIKIQEEL
jgi:hypothetical protein